VIHVQIQTPLLDSLVWGENLCKKKIQIFLHSLVDGDTEIT